MTENNDNWKAYVQARTDMAKEGAPKYSYARPVDTLNVMLQSKDLLGGIKPSDDYRLPASMPPRCSKKPGNLK